MEFFMQFIDLINNLGGYVTIQADGIFLERFLNICTCLLYTSDAADEL